MIKNTIDYNEYLKLIEKNTSKKGNITPASHELRHVYRYGRYSRACLKEFECFKSRYDLLENINKNMFFDGKRSWKALYRAARVYEKTMLNT